MLIASFALSVACCAQPVEPPQWRSEVIFKAPVKTGGCAIGDVDPRTPGNEVVVVSVDGSVFVIGRVDGKFEGRHVFTAPGELIQVAVGDALPERPGLEIVAVGKAQGGEREPGPGAVYLVHADGEGWHGRKLVEAGSLVHAVCFAGERIFVGGFDEEAVELVRDGDGFRAETLARLPGRAKNCIAVQDRIVYACTDGSLFAVREEADGWVGATIDRRESGRARLGTDGERILVSDDDGTFSLVDARGRTEIFRATARQRGAVFGDFDPRRPGLELGTGGYDGRVRVLWEEGDRYHAVIPFVDFERIHHTAAGNLDDDPADELVTCGYSSLVVLTQLVDDGAP